MARIPGWLLRHTVIVEAATSTWGAFGTATSLKCFVDERMSGRRTRAGVERVAQITLYAAPGTVVPEGSKITLPDGRVGYASAVVAHDGGGLPTPDHVEIAVDVGTVAGPAFGETVTILTRTITGTDAFGNDRYTTTSTPVDGCSVRPITSREDLADGRTQVTDAVEVIFPPSTTITVTDRLTIQGLTYAVDGTPEETKSSMTGSEPGVRVIAKRVTT